MNENAKEMECRTNLAIGFIKSRRAERKVTDFYERMESRIEESKLECLFIDLDIDGDRSLDRPQLDEVYTAMQQETVSHLFLRDIKDITDDWEDIMEFIRFAAENEVTLHFVNLEPWGEDIPEKVWDGECGC